MVTLALSSLRNRIFLASALLTVVSIGTAMYFVNAEVSLQAEAEMQRGLDEAGTLVEEYRSLLFDHFVREVRLLADLPRLKAGVFDSHVPTVRPLVEEYRKQLDAAVLLVTDRNGVLLAEAGLPGLDPAAVAREPNIQAALLSRTAVAYWPRADRILQVVSVPITIGLDQPEVLGTISAAISLDANLADRFKRLTQREIAFGLAGTILATTLPPAFNATLSGLLAEGRSAPVVLGDEEYVSIRRALAPPRADALGPDGPAVPGDQPVPMALVLESRTERLRFLRALHTTLAVTAILAVIAATVLSYLVSRTVTRPLGVVTAAMRQMAADGDLTRRIDLPPGRGSDDEDTRLLATSFNAMTVSIARFQREVNQRERLSSLGRLSTIIAHEIRNPLMIIKTALRGLRRPDVTAATIEEGVRDIDEEVDRLNRIVTEVLDFARPVRFDHADTDVNALCRDAVAAVSAGRGLSDIALDLVPGLPLIRTDGERLRQVLANLLENAVDAVASRATLAGSTAPRAASIIVRTAMTGSRTVRLAIRDFGSGIEPGDQPHVFEPYFTTKRTGTGIGLAIAKNVIEGLGGTIGVWSRTGEGTEFTVELPLTDAAGTSVGPASTVGREPPTTVTTD